MQVKHVKLSELKPAPHNPSRRAKGPMLRQLAKSVSQIGLIYPIAITKAGNIIDGHRRVAVAKEAGWETIPAIIAEGNAETVYAHVNANSKILSGAEKLAVWLKNPSAVLPRAAGRFEKAEQILGRTLLVRMSKNGLSLTMFRYGGEISRYITGENSPAIIKRAVLWLLRHSNVNSVRDYMLGKHPPKALKDALFRGTDLKVSYRAA